MDRFDIFVSYSRMDKRKVRDLSKLLTIGGNSLFIDEVHIKPGDRWRIAITDAIKSCKKLVVFWSHNAAGSQHVRDEYSFALKHEIDVAPVCLDKTPLPEPLCQYQAIDLSDYKKPKILVLTRNTIIIVIAAIIFLAVMFYRNVHRKPLEPYDIWPIIFLGTIKTGTSEENRKEAYNAGIYKMLYEHITGESLIKNA